MPICIYFWQDLLKRYIYIYIYKYINLDLMRDYYTCDHQVTYEFVYNRLGWFLRRITYMIN